MNCYELQTRLIALGHYRGAHDGLWGPNTRRAVLDALTAGPDTPIHDADARRAAKKLRCDEPAIWAVYDVEASGNPFIDGRPTILFEPHRFSRTTKRRFDRSHPHISYRKWRTRPYPARQIDRYNQLLDAMALDIDAALMSASWGGFQILGENYKVCGYPTPWDFALDQSQSVGDQLDAFIGFCIGNGLDRHLRSHNWASFARGYNGTGYKANRYDSKLANRYAVRLRIARSHTR